MKIWKRAFVASLGISAALTLLSAPVGLAADKQENPQLVLWMDHPAKEKSWNNAFPVGNGRLGAMVFGGVSEEHIQFNEDTLWAGKPHDYVREGAYDLLGKMRDFIFAGNAKGAEALAGRTSPTFLSDPIRQLPYQPFGDLHLTFPTQGGESYRRELNLNDAVARVTYESGGVTYTRDCFASFPDQVIVYHVHASRPGQVTFAVGMSTPHKESEVRVLGSDVLELSGKVQPDGLRFDARLRAMATGGTISTRDGQLVINGADSATLLLTGATSFVNFQDISGDPARKADADMQKLAGKTYEQLWDAHEEDFHNLFDRVRLNLGHTGAADKPTDERVAACRTGGLARDPGLATLDFQYGRYLLISCSRAGGQPANLQGLWNADLNPPWESKWTTNINLEMNYWPAEVANLGECTAPLFDLIDDLAISGARTAKEQYHAGGWVLHHNTDLWRGTAPINGPDGVWPTGGAWLCYHLWEHYLFTQDKDFLAKRAYPDMKSASQFFVDTLVKDPRTGWLVTTPSFSPEHGGLVAGPAMDMQLIRALFDSTIEASHILKVDPDFAHQLADLRAKLVPDQVGHFGQLQEWEQDLDAENDNHRHMSPLWGLYPGAQFTPANPKIWSAANVLLKQRGDGSTGWSYAWRICLWARADNGDRAFSQLSDLLGKRTLPNMWDLCGPFQIDGNFGACAGIGEMLLQSQQLTDGQRGDPVIELLPALPKPWAAGEVSGLRARGGFEVAETWQNGELTQATIKSLLGNPVDVRYHGHDVRLTTQPGGTYVLDANLGSH